MRRARLAAARRTLRVRGVGDRRAATFAGDSAGRLAFAFPMALWILRWLATDREPTPDDMVQIVVALERGLALPALNRAVEYLAESSELERIVAWYAR